jgi:hypothetical protein
MRHFLLAFSVLAATSAYVLPARADEGEAETCLRSKIWEGYSTGWAVRTSTKATLTAGAHKVYLVTLYAGNEYKLLACGDANVSNADLVLYDHAGKQVAADTSNDREPTISFTPQATDTYYIAAHASRLNGDAQTGALATAVTYK